MLTTYVTFATHIDVLYSLLLREKNGAAQILGHGAKPLIDHGV